MVESGDLNEFFEQILHTERSLSSRNTKLRQLKEEIQSCMTAVAGVQQEVEAQQRELAVRNVKMVDQEVEAKLLAIKEDILEQQHNQLLTINHNLSKELEAANLKFEAEREEFLQEMREFGQSYDLIGAGVKHREQLVQKKVSTLQDELLLLEAELEVFECEREEVGKLEGKLMSVEKQFAQKQEAKKLLEREIEEDEEEIKRLREECETFGSKPPTDPEVIKLQKELEECKDCPEEKMYHSLHKELEELQRLCYHKQMKQHISQRNTLSEGVSSHNQYVRNIEGSHGSYEFGDEARNLRQEQTVEEDDRDEEEEGWDDELEAAELASFNEKLGALEMEWLVEEEDEEEKEGGEEKEDDNELVKNIPEDDRVWRGHLVGQNKRSGASARSNTEVNKENPRKRVTEQTPHIPRQSTSKAVRTVVKRRSSQTQVADSPATNPTRKSSGQSIFKVPSQQSSHHPLDRVPKTAKRVRFRY